MADIAAVLFAIIAVAYISALVIGLIAAWPIGIPILVVLLCFVGLFFGVVRQRLDNEEDDYYSKNVDK